MAAEVLFIRSLIDDFLQEKRESVGGGWAKVVPEDIGALERIVNALIKAKCESDADGDYPIECVFVNRRLYEPLSQPFLIRYDHQIEDDPEEMADNLDLAFANLVSAMNAVERMMKSRGYQKSQAAAS